MANIKYGPGIMEFYAPDSFERLGTLSYCTMDTLDTPSYYATTVDTMNAAPEVHEVQRKKSRMERLREELKTLRY